MISLFCENFWVDEFSLCCYQCCNCTCFQQQARRVVMERSRLMSDGILNQAQYVQFLDVMDARDRANAGDYICTYRMLDLLCGCMDCLTCTEPAFTPEPGEEEELDTTALSYGAVFLAAVLAGKLRHRQKRHHFLSSLVKDKALLHRLSLTVLCSLCILCD